MRASLDLDVERDVPAFHVALAHDGAGRDDVRLSELGVDAVEPGIAIGPVDDGFEARGQRHWLIGEIDGEVRRLGLAIDLDALERAAILSDRRQDAADALDVVEVGVSK